jgi:hypothetical protein
MNEGKHALSDKRVTNSEWNLELPLDAGTYGRAWRKGVESMSRSESPCA